MPGIKRTRKQVASKKKPISRAKPAPKKSAAKKSSKKPAPKINKRATKAKNKAASPEPSDSDDGKNLVERKTALSNGVMVDHKIPNPQQYVVVKYCNMVLNANLMYSDCGHNNNKFYIIQGLKSGNTCWLWTRWGRVGVDGQVCKQACGSEAMLYNMYYKKLNQKTSKGYKEIKISYEDTKETEKKANKLSKKNVKKNKSKLSDEVQDLMKFIFDMKQIEKSVVKVGFNVKKLPLGKLSKETIKNGYTALKKIEKALKKKNKQELSELSSEFYTYIPHDFGFQKMSNFIIDNKDKLKEKLDLVQTLGDIQITAEIDKEVADQDDELHELDAKYKRLNCKIEPLSKSSKEYKTLIQTLNMKVNSQQKTTFGFFGGGSNAPTMTPLEVFKISRQGESRKFKKKMGNRKLLWHGSTFSNWGGILSQGLRIAPPEAPCCGYAFGKGVYFADIPQKSSGYTRHYMSDNIGLLALCDVAIGKPYHATNCNSGLNKKTIPKGTDSTHAKGYMVPSKSYNMGGADLQLGPIDNKQSNGWLYQSEFIMYDVDQIEMKYLFKCRIG